MYLLALQAENGAFGRLSYRSELALPELEPVGLELIFLQYQGKAAFVPSVIGKNIILRNSLAGVQP